MPLDMVLLGPPGAGKGTQAKRISAELGVPSIATGDMMRAAIGAGSELGLEIKPYYDRGDLVPDELTMGLIRERLSQADSDAGFLLDGFPRNLGQAEALDAMLDEIGRELSIVFEFQVPDEVALARMLAREDNRSDDTPEVIRRRLAVFHENTAPVIGYYRAKGILVGIHAERSINEVFAEIQDALEQVAVR